MRLIPGFALWLLLALASLSAPAQDVATGGDYMVDRWTTADGLPVNAINQVLLGRDGYLWLATFDGLVRFDGHRFTTFTSADHPALITNRVGGLRQTADGMLWLGVAPASLVSFDGYAFHRYGVEDGLPGAAIWAIHQDANGDIWVSGADGWLARRVAGRRFETWGKGSTLGHARAVEPGPDGDYWAVGDGGLHQLRNRRLVRTVAHADGVAAPAQRFLRDTAHAVWITASDTVLVNHPDARVMQRLGPDVLRIEQAGDTVAAVASLAEHTLPADGSRIRSRPLDPAFQAFGGERLLLTGSDGSLWHNRMDRLDHDGRTVLRPDCKINDMAADAGGAIWVATACEGLYRLRPRHISAITRVQGKPLGPVYGLAEDPDGALWMATLNRGVAVLEKDGTGRWLDLPEARNGLHTLHVSPDGQVRIGRCLLLPDQTCRPASDVAQILDPLESIGGFLRARDGTLWMGGATLWRRPPDGDWVRETTVPTTEGIGNGGRIRALLETSDGSLWLGTLGDGIKRRTPDGRWQHLRLEQGLTTLAIRALREDRDGQVWVATENLGLCRVQYRKPAMPIACLTRAQGLWSNSLHQILIDDDERLWINSNHGVFAVPRAAAEVVLDGRAARVHPQVFSENDGLPDREGNGGVHDAGIRLSDGRIAFPTQNGVALFHPRDLRPSATSPRARFETLALPGQEHQPVTASTILPRGQRSVTLNYTGLSSDLTSAVYFRYRMSPQTGWTDLGDVRQLSLDQLSPGHHTIELQAFGSSGQPGDSAWLTLHVPPYLHETLAFRIALAVAVALAVIALMLRQRHNARRRQRLLQATVAERTDELRGALEENERLASSKARFFANVSHELRTPLTLMVGPLDDLALGMPLTPALAQAMSRNAHRLERLIEQLLDLERIDANRFPLHPEPIDLVALVSEALVAFTPLARAERIALQSTVPDTALTVQADAEQLMRVIGNLLSNALKFCPAEGQVRLTLTHEPAGGATLRVEDTGPGVPEAWRESIFDRFSQMGSAATRQREGAGLGLALCREVAQLHGGRLYATDSELGGACFVFGLPAPQESPLAQPAESPSPPVRGVGVRVRDAADDSEVPGQLPSLRRGHTPTSIAPHHDSARSQAQSQDDGQLVQGQGSDNRPLLLLAEDNPDLRHYLTTILAGHYRVTPAEDGQIALAHARTEAPDLIVTDLMMPNLDGLGLARAIRAEPELAGVPIVFLTARASDADRIHGLQGGADYYLTKPFDSRVLLAQLAAALRACQRLRERYIAAVPASPEPDSLQSAFAQRWHNTLQSHFHDPDLDVAALARHLHMSRATLSRHCQAELSAGPGELLRSYRLQHAHTLLQQRIGNVSEVAYAVGYTRLASFSRAYRDHFGHPPGST